MRCMQCIVDIDNVGCDELTLFITLKYSSKLCELVKGKLQVFLLSV